MKTSMLNKITTPFKTGFICDSAGNHFFSGFVSGYVAGRKHLMRGTWDDGKAAELAAKAGEQYSTKIGESYVNAPAKHFAEAFEIAYTEVLDDKDMKQVLKGERLRSHTRQVACWYQLHISSGGAV